MHTIVPLNAVVDGTIRRHQLLQRGDRVLLALSGGPDSVALLRVLVDLQAQYGISLACAHLNHGFRGAEADRDQCFAAELSQRFGLPFFSSKIDVPQLLGERYGSAQMVARQVRYEFLERVAEQEGCRRIALAHNRNDRLETFLLRLVSGIAPAGLASIPIARGRIIRPLLEADREQITHYLQSLQQPAMEDSSNRSLRYRRNLVRHRLVPVLADLFPGFQDRLLRLMDDCTLENHYWQEQFGTADRLGLAVEKNGFSFALEKLRIAPLPLVCRSLAHYATLTVPGGRGPGHAFFRHLPELLPGGRGERIWFRNRFLEIREERKRVYLQRVSGSFRQGATSFQYSLQPGENHLPWGRLRLERRPAGGQGRKFFQAQAKKGIFWINSDSIAPPLIARNREAGDRIDLSGTGSKKIKDLLIDGGIPLRLRRECTVLADRDGVVACLIPGLPEKSRVGTRAMIRSAGEALVLEICAWGEE